MRMTAEEIAPVTMIARSDFHPAPNPAAASAHDTASPPSAAKAAAALGRRTTSRVRSSYGLPGEGRYGLQSKSLSGECAMGILPNGAGFGVKH